MKKIVTEYIGVLENIGAMISNSPFKTSYIINRMGMKPNTFHTKVRNKNFTPYEMMSLMQIIDTEAVKVEILNSREQARRGLSIDHKDVMAEAYRMVEEV